MSSLLSPVSSTYETVSQFSILDNALAEASRRTVLSQDWRREQLGLRAIEDNIGGHLRLPLLNYFVQWSIAALTFPPAARAFNEYVDRYPDVPLREKIGPITLHPPASIKNYVIYPAFLGAGLVSLLLGIGVVVFLWKPELAERPRLHYLMLAGFFSAMWQVHTIVVSLVNVATSRFLMAVYPQLILVFIFLVVATFPSLTTSGRAYERRTA